LSVEVNIDVPLPEFVGTDEDARELLRLSLRKIEEDPDDFIGLDTETHGKKIPIRKKPLDPITDTVTYWSMAYKLGEEYRRWCISQEYFLYFSPLLESPKLNIAGWNLKYDAHIAWNCGINLWNARRPVDGLVLAQLLDENRRSHGLKACAADFVGLQMTPYKSLFDDVRDEHGKKPKEFETSLVELVELGYEDVVSDYASYDGYAHLKTVEWLIERLTNTPIGVDSNLWEYFLSMEMQFTEQLWRMERRGMHVDLDYLESQIPVINGRINKLEKTINRLAGRPINISSPKQLAAFFFGEDGLGLDPVKLTATQQPSTDEEVMDSLVEAGVEVAQMVVDCRKLIKTRSTYLDALITMANYYEDGRIHPSFNQMGARTGRLSTENPNSQNFPRPDNDEWGIRRAFSAPPGKKLIVADYEQIEMRIMADFSGDKQMIQAIQQGKDLHSFTVAITTPGVKYDEVVAAKKADDPDDRQKWLRGQRQEKKAVGFGIIYGAGPPQISTQIDISDEEWQGKLDEMAQDTFERRVIRLMKKNPLLTEEQAVEQVGKASVAGDKIAEYFEAFPGVKGFMDQTPVICRHRMHYDEENRERKWEFKFRLPGAKPTSESGHSKPFGYVQTLCGRYRRLEDIDHRNYFFRSQAERQAVNTRIQGSAGDITKAAMLRIEHHPVLNMLGVMVINQVHDEIVIEVPEEHAEEVAPIIKHCMENPFGDEPEDAALGVPIPVDLKIVDNWAQAK
jgi:DNA polymerase-1